MKTLVIGDIHGCYAELMSLLDCAALGRDDKIIALGDILDRGPDSKKVSEFFSSNERASCLMGNHEHKHILVKNKIIHPALSQEITRTQFSSEQYSNLIDTIEHFPLYVETESSMLVHGSFEPGIHISEQKKAVLLGTRNGETYLRLNYKKPWYELYDLDKPVIVGHRNHSKNGEIRIINENVFFLDTGCCYGKYLSAIQLPDFKVFQVRSHKNYWGIIKQLAVQEKHTIK